MSWWDDDDEEEFDDSEFEDLEPDELEEELDESEDDVDWDDLDESPEELDSRIISADEVDGDPIHHFDFIEDAIAYAEGAPYGVLWVVIDDDGGADVYRDEGYGEEAA